MGGGGVPRGGPGSEKKLKSFGRVRGWPGSVLVVFWWSFIEVFVVLSVFCGIFRCISFRRCLAG